MVELVRNAIAKRQHSNNNSSGTSLLYLKTELNLTMEEVSQACNKLFLEKFIDIRSGINGKLIFLKNHVERNPKPERIKREA